MDRAEWMQVKAIALEALALPQAVRDALISARCLDNGALRVEVLSLIESSAKAAGLFETPRLATAGVLEAIADGDDLRNSIIGGRIGAYRVISELGRGGMGTAYLAARADDAYEKRVAIKLVKRGMDSDAILKRFRHERQILADLEHPNIVMLLDGGSTDDGQPYFVMEYVDGVSIDVYCKKEQLTVRDRLKLFLAICSAVQHAHEHRVLHRDLKPGNILVMASGVPKLLDFGIARLLDVADEGFTREPTLFARAMTPQFASPEQLRGEPLTPASDVYSLGVILYELIAGRNPFALEGRTPRDVERIVCEDAPPPPSTILPSEGARLWRRRTGRRRLSGDLDAITLTALAKLPAQRYASAHALADDIRRHLDGLPILARPPRWRFLAAHRQEFVAATALTMVAAAAVWIFLQPGTAPPIVPATGIAVLPFQNVAGNPEIEYLSDGLTEGVINRLSRDPRLRVIARDSAYRYQGESVDLVTAGRELDVPWILTGRVMQRGPNLVVTVQLVDTQDGRQIWGERYDRGASEIQGVRDELSQQVAVNLQLQQAHGAPTPVSSRRPQDAAAYEAYLKGRYFWNKRTVSAFRTSIEYFRQAVERDSSFALAYTGIADAYGLLTEYHELLAEESYELAKIAALQALAIDPDLPEGHVSLAYLSQFYEWDFAKAEAEYRRALELDPNNATGHQWYAEFLAMMGRHDEALQEIHTALTIDPLSLIVNAVEANIQYMGGNYDAAIAKANEVVAMEPNFPEVYEYFKRSYDRKQQYRDAITARQTRRRLIGLDSTWTPALAAAAEAVDAKEYWRRRLEQELTESETEGILPYEFVEIYAQTGDIELALDWLERACAQHEFMLLYLRVAPNIAPLRSEPRYQAIVETGCGVSA